MTSAENEYICSRSVALWLSVEKRKDKIKPNKRISGRFSQH